MSKAFTKENESPDGDDLDPREESEDAALQGRRNYITPEGADRLKGELRQLLTVARPDLVKTVQWAASNGDRSENGDYIYGKRKLREIDRRIRFLTKRLEAAEIVDPALQATQAAGRILFGATVTVRDEEGSTRAYRIVGVDEIDARNGHVSWLSPVAKALLNAKAGETVTLRTPKGDEELEIVSVRYA